MFFSSVDSLLLALSRRCESLFAQLFVMESNTARDYMARVAVASLFKFTQSALPLPRQSPGSCCSVSHSIADEGAGCIMIRDGDGKANRRVVHFAVEL